MPEKPSHESLEEKVRELKRSGTDLEAAEKALRRANKIISRSPAVTFIWKNAEGWPVEYVSDNVDTIFGWDQKDFITGHVPYAQVVFSDDLPRVEREVLHASIDPDLKNIKHAPYRIVARDGSIKWVEDFTTVLRKTDGTVDAYEGILLDITDRKLMEEKLRLIQFSVDRASDGITWIDADGRIIYVNDAACEQSGFTREELMSMTIFDIDPTVTPENWRKRWEKIRKAGTLSFETEHRTKAGKIIPVEISLKFIAFNENEFCLTFSRDITERIHAKAALERRLVALTRPVEDPKEISFEELFNLEDIQCLQDEFAQASGVSSIITHTDGTPITKPSNFCRLCRDIIRKTEKGQINCHKSDAVLGRVNLDGPVIQPCMSSGLWGAGASISVDGRHIANWLIGQVRDETQTDETMRAYARKIGADEKTFIEAFHEVPAMSRKQFGFVAKVLFTLANQLSTMAYQNVQQARFITERDNAEKEKETLQVQVQQAQKLESVGRLAGGVAHDLNNLLAPILGYSEMLLDDFSPNDHRRASAQQILEAGNRARDIVKQLLAFSRKQTMKIRPVDLNRMLDQFSKLLRRTIREDITIKLDTQSSLKQVMGDFGQLEQVVMNLAVNAQDAMPDGGMLSIATAMVELDETYSFSHNDIKPGAYVMLSISDTGHGMDEEIRSHIFEPFFSTKGERGTGLGLSTVYGIVKQHGGDIYVYSEPEEGTVFKIYLPVSEDTSPDRNIYDDSSENLQGSGTILLVEDNDQVRTMTGNLLSRRSYHVLSAGCGEDALKLLSEHSDPVHLLLTDVVMPDMNGKDLFQKAAEMRPDIKVLYMSGYTDNVIAHRGVLDESVEFIQKPFSVRALATKIREVLG